MASSPLRSSVLAALLAALAATAPAELALAQKTAAQRAEELNDQGKQLFADQKYTEALARFRQAVVIEPAGKYYFNVCFTLAQLDRDADAIKACEAVAPNGADDDLLAKTNKLLGTLRERAGAQPAGETTETATSSGTETGAAGTEPGGGTTAASQTTGQGPGASVEKKANLVAPPPNRRDYNWSVGIELFGLNNVSIGDELGDGRSRFGDGGFSVRGFGSLLFDKARRLGGQAYVSYSVLPSDAIASVISDAPLSIIDLGVAATWSIPVGSRFDLTPLLGAQVSVQGPSDSDQAFVAVGMRAGASFDWILDEAGRHALSLNAALNLYSRAGGRTEADYRPADYGLDNGGLDVLFGLGYTLRFQTPLGQLGFFTLE